MPQGVLVSGGGPWWASLLRSGNNSRRAVDGAIGAAATLGLSIVILKLVAEAFKSAKRDGQESSTFRIVQEILRGLFRKNEQEEEAVDSIEIETVLHKGSCHCRSVAFELAAPRTLVAEHGPGKISYAHTRTRARNFQFVKGTDHLQIYYVSVPAGSEHGVEPTIGAHTFCSRCGVHILHAASPTSDILHVNVCCVDGGSKPKIKWNQRNHLSSGVPVARQWEEEQSTPSAWGTMESEEVTLESFAEENPETPDAPSEHSSWKSATREPSPGTPSTVGTVGTDSIVSAMRYRSSALEQNDAASEDSEPLPRISKPLLPPLNTSLSTRSVESPSRKTPTTTTPMMRDQLKYYMSKHLPSSTTGTPTKAKAETTPRETQP